MNLIISIVSAISLFIHADGIAEYHYSLDQNHILLTVEMDQRELQHYQTQIGCSGELLAVLCTSKYMQSNTSFFINGVLVAFEFETASDTNGHVIINLRSIKKYDQIKTIQVKNSCFYEFNPAFKNRIRIDIENFQKSYLLTKGKEQISS